MKDKRNFFIRFFENRNLKGFLFRLNIGDMFLRLGSLSPFRYTATKCGHRTQRTGQVSAFGQTITTKMPTNENGSMDYCLDCIGKMAIRCAWCGDPIFIGNPITLYTPHGDFQVPEHAIVYNKEPLQLVGCLGWNCAETGADRAGFWVAGQGRQGARPACADCLRGDPQRHEGGCEPDAHSARKPESEVAQWPRAQSES